MLQVPYLRENTEKALSGLAKRNKDFSATVESIISVDESRRKLQNELDNLLAESNKISKVIGDLFKEGKRESIKRILKETREDKIKSFLFQRFDKVFDELKAELAIQMNQLNKLLAQAKI